MRDCGAQLGMTLMEKMASCKEQLHGCARKEMGMSLGGGGGAINRRSFLGGFAAAGAVAGSAAVMPAAAAQSSPERPAGISALKINAVELLELRGRYTTEAGVDRQAQVNPLDVYDQFRPAPYQDKPGGTREVQYEAIYIRI